VQSEEQKETPMEGGGPYVRCLRMLCVDGAAFYVVAREGAGVNG
jgi:hypothetical protein